MACEPVHFPHEEPLNLALVLTTEIDERQELGAVGELRGFTLLDEDLNDFHPMLFRVRAARVLLRFEARSVDLFFGRDAAIDDNVNPVNRTVE